MGTRSAWAVFVLACLIGTAHADPKGDIEKKTKEAMESYDLMDYGAAKKLLDQALAIAKKHKLDKEPLTARIYIAVGIAAFANSDVDAAKLAFLSAAQIDPKIQIEAAYKSPELNKLLEEARSEASGGGGSSGGSTEPLTDAIDCATVKGLQHTILDAGKVGVAQPIEAYLGSDVAAVKVAIMYRAEGATDFSEVKMAKSAGCKYTGKIPAAAMKGTVVHYFVAAYDNNNKPIASKGSSGSPNIMELGAGGAPVKPDTEDPINGAKPAGGSGDTGNVSGGVIAGGKPPKIMIAVTAGTGVGYVSGTTENNNPVLNPGIASSLVVVTPEIGFYVNPRTSISVAARLGFPIGANVEGHATLAPAAVVRVRYTLSESGEGVRVMGQVGGGIMRNTLKINDTMPGMDTDIVAQGPLLIGGGIGYMKKLGGTVALILDLSALAGIAVVDKIGTATLNSGVSADLSIGVSLGF